MSRTAPSVFPHGDGRTKWVLGVDRLDYTKGLVARLRALDRFFDEFPQWIGKVTFLQVNYHKRSITIEDRLRQRFSRRLT